MIQRPVEQVLEEALVELGGDPDMLDPELSFWLSPYRFSVANSNYDHKVHSKLFYYLADIFASVKRSVEGVWLSFYSVSRVRYLPRRRFEGFMMVFEGYTKAFEGFPRLFEDLPKRFEGLRKAFEELGEAFESYPKAFEGVPKGLNFPPASMLKSARH